MDWFKFQLLPNHHEPSLIIVDNASYDERKPADTPNVGRMRKADVLETLDRIGVAYPEKLSAVEAKLLLEKWQNENVEMEIVQLAHEAGHEVLFPRPAAATSSPSKWCGNW